MYVASLQFLHVRCVALLSLPSPCDQNGILHSRGQPHEAVDGRCLEDICRSSGWKNKY